jgi:Domain of unknown function (DUF6532)
MALDEWLTGTHKNIDLSESAYKTVWQSIYEAVEVVASNADCGPPLKQRLNSLAQSM